MRKLLVALTVGLLVAATGVAQDTKEPAKKAPAKKKPALKLRVKEKPAVTLHVGDSAPPLKASKWLQGDEVKGFESGKTYVVEFWATWCGPCIVMMPHLAEMQAEYKDRGVTFIGYTAEGRNNSEEKVIEFVKKRGPKLQYTFAFANDQETYNAWMQAAGRTGIPCSFLVDKAGKIAFIGHPMYLDVVLPKVIDGTWKGPAELEALEKEVDGVFQVLQGRDAEASLKALGDFETRHPALAKIPYFVAPRISSLLRRGRASEARNFAEEVLARAQKQEDPMALRTVSGAMRSEDAKGDKGCLALSMKAADALLAVAGDKDVMALFNMAEAHLAAGDKAKAKEFGQKAIDAADSPATKRSVELRVKQFDAQSKGDDK
jgi:thiol-disulfide isomerase/thioredoxin